MCTSISVSIRVTYLITHEGAGRGVIILSPHRALLCFRYQTELQPRCILRVKLTGLISHHIQAMAQLQVPDELSAQARTLGNAEKLISHCIQDD